jgi:hypothetical protein
MSKHPITDTEAQQLLSGTTPAGRPELSAFAASIADVRRDAAHLAAPQPSVALAARLERPALGASEARRNGVTTAASPIARFGIAAKIAAAVGVLALGLLGVGAAGALPGAAQDAFDGVVSTLTPTEGETTDGGVTDDDGLDDGGVGDGAAEEPALPVGSGEFSDWVKQGARDPNKIGSEFGAAVAEQARELKNEKAEERAADEGTDDTTDGTPNDTPNGPAGSNSGGNGNGNGTGNGNTGAATQDDDESSNGNGKPADPPAGRP